MAAIIQFLSSNTSRENKHTDGVPSEHTGHLSRAGESNSDAPLYTRQPV